MGRLHDIGLKHGTDKATAHKYLDFYEARIGTPKIIYEFGVLNGASLRMWHEAFPDATIIGFDINPVVQPEGTFVVKMDASKRNYITDFKPSVDLIVDDASHITQEQIDTFNLWWPFIAPGGCYIIEDIHTMHYTGYNPTGIDLKKWISDLGIRHEYYTRVPGDESDSMTVILYK
jgi:hypothetical protein